MKRELFSRSIAGVALLTAGYVFSAQPMAAETPLSIGSARITVSGTSNVHAYWAATTSARVTNVQIAPSVVGASFWDEIVKPGGLQAFEIAIPAAKLASDKEGLDKNLYKALKVDKFPEITFRLARFELKGKAFRAIGTLKIAGVEREVAFVGSALRQDAGLTVKGSVEILMTDYGITPPTAMLGVFRTDPKVTVAFETRFIVPTT